MRPRLFVAWLGFAAALTACAPSRVKSATVRQACASVQLNEQECLQLETMQWPEHTPPARGNRFGDDAKAAQFGFQMFFSPYFSPSGSVRCATCHMPEHSFDDHKPTAVGIGTSVRNAPSLLNAAHVANVFWDGRADSLWSQPLFAIENPVEMASSRLALVKTIATQPLVRDAYEKAFGTVPDVSHLPPSGKPGEPAWDGLSAQDQHLVNGIVANFGKGLEAYVRKIAAGAAPFDAFLRGDKAALSVHAQRGLKVFFSAGCAACHSGPTLSDGGFHAVDVPDPEGAPVDRGLAAARDALSSNPFNRFGVFYDDVGTPMVLPEPSAADERAFRTPTLRNLMLSAPYGHSGVYESVFDVLAQHGPVGASAADIDALVTFFFSLNGAYPEKPWSDWPTL